MYHHMKQKHISVFAHTIFTFMLLADFPLYRLFLTHTFRPSDEGVAPRASQRLGPGFRQTSPLWFAAPGWLQEGFVSDLPMRLPKEVQRGEVRTPW